MTPTLRSRALRVLVLQVLVSGGLLALLLSHVSVREVAHQAGRIPARTWGLGLAACAAAWVIEAARLCLLARGVRQRLSFRRALHINLVSNVYAFALFGWVGGGGYRAWRFSREGWGIETSLMVLLADRALAVAGLCAGTAILAACTRFPPHLAPWIITGALASSLALCLPVGKTSQGTSIVVDASDPSTWWRRLLRAWRLLSSGGPRRIAAGIALSLLASASGWAWTLLSARDVGIHLPWIDLAMVIGLVSLAQQVPLSWLGTGVREASYEILLSRCGATSGAGIALGSAQLCVALAWVGVSLVGHLLVPARRLCSERGVPGA